MPTVGFYCPVRHGAEERRQVRFEDCLGPEGCARRGNPPCNFPYAILSGIARKQGLYRTPPAPNYVTTTMLTGCLTRAYLQRVVDLYDPPEDAFWAFRGDLAHQIAAANAMEGAITEERIILSLDGNGRVLSGQPDTLEPLPGGGYAIWDYKSTRRVPEKPYKHHLRQLSIYTYLVLTGGQDGAGNAVPARDVRCVYLAYFDMGEVRVFRIPENPAEAIKPERVQQFFQKKVVPQAHALIDALENGTPPAPGTWHETWNCKKCSARHACPLYSKSRRRSAVAARREPDN